MKTVVLQSNYLPWRGYFSLIKEADMFCFYDEVQYTKNDWRNRNIIYTKNGESWITIPINKSAVKKKISEVIIGNDKWKNLHYKSIVQGYKKAPFFNQLEFLLDFVFIDNDWDKLSNLNQSCIKRISNYFELNTMFFNSKDYQLIEGKVPRLLNLLNQLKCKTYLSGPSGKNYLQDYTDTFKENNVDIEYIQYPNKPYKQLSESFINYVSIVDLIANVKKEEIINYL